MNATDYAIQWWKNRHEAGYFPFMDQHKDWKIYDEIPRWFIDAVDPKPTDVACEIGCGYGQWMIPLSKLVKGVFGFDIHHLLHQKANEKFLEYGARCNVTVGDGKTIPYPDSCFDLVYSISVFQHIPRATVHGYITETNRVLKQGGRALFYFRADDHNGPYSSDISVDHNDDWSVGWSVEQCMAKMKSIKWNRVNCIDMGDVILLVGYKT